LKQITAILFLLFSFQLLSAQIGGLNIYDFLQYPNSARMAGINGSTLSKKDGDLSLSFSNPCFIDTTLHKQLVFSNSFYIDKTNLGNVLFAYHHPKIKSTLLYGIQYANYGKFDGRDAAGNSTGTFHAADFNFQVSTARHFNRFYYGVSLKFIVSHLASYTSLGLGTDVAIGYSDTKSRLSFAFVLHNAGAELKPYIKGEGRQKLPMQLDWSLSKSFKHLPLTIYVTAHNLQTWKLTYPEEEQQIILLGTSKKKNKGAEIVDNLFRHTAFGLEVQAGKPVQLRFGYNHLRRQELGIGKKKGFAGFTAGFGVNIKQFAFDYGFAQYNRTGNDHQITLRIKLDEFGHKAK